MNCPSLIIIGKIKYHLGAKFVSALTPIRLGGNAKFWTESSYRKCNDGSDRRFSRNGTL